MIVMTSAHVSLYINNLLLLLPAAVFRCCRWIILANASGGANR
jgi:hypothetical protein